MTRVQHQSLPFSDMAQQTINKVCLFLVHNGNLILVVRHHAKDNSVSIEPAGGKIDPKENGDLETPDEALVREADQELGVIIKPMHMMSVELHPHTGKPVAYYSCDHVSGTPYNKAHDEHLGILEIPLRNIKSYDDLRTIALDMAQKIVDDARAGEPLSRPIEFRVPERPVMNFIQQFTMEPGAAFVHRDEENFASTPKPA